MDTKSLLKSRGNVKLGIDYEDYCAGAVRLQTDVATIRSVDAVESAGSGFLPSKRPKILFEGHLFFNLAKRHGKAGAIAAEAGSICYPKWTTAHYVGREGEYRRLESAIALCLKYGLPTDYALRCASWGRFQILADNYKKSGFKSAVEFVDAMFLDEDNHLEAFLSFVENSFIDDDLKAHKWAVFAAVYNGPAYKRNKYDLKMANAYAQFSKQKIDCQKLLHAAKKQEISVIMPAVRYTFTETEGFAHTSLDERYTEENPFENLLPGEVVLINNSSPASFPSVSAGNPADSNLINGQNPDNSAHSVNEQTINAQAGESSVSVQQSTAPLGDTPDAEPKKWLEIEDLKPYVLDRLGFIWKWYRNFNAPQLPTLNGLSLAGLKAGFRWWWIPIAFSILFFILTTLVALGAALVYGVIMLVNRHENRKAREKVADSLKDPNAFNLGLRIIKKFASGKSESKIIDF